MGARATLARKGLRRAAEKFPGHCRCRACAHRRPDPSGWASEKEGMGKS